MKRWNMDGDQVLEMMKKVIPSPEDGETIKRLIGGSFNTKVEFARLCLADDIPKDLYNKIASFQFALSKIGYIEKKFNLLPEKQTDSYPKEESEVETKLESDEATVTETVEPSTEKQQPLTSEKPFPCKSGTQWKDVKITLTANDKVRIETPQGKGPFTYHKLGMDDGRSGDKPNKLWRLLVIFAKTHGIVSLEDIKDEKDRKGLFSTTKRLNKHLRELFGINESIYQWPYGKYKKYKTKIFFSNQTVVHKEKGQAEDENNVSIFDSEVEKKKAIVNLPESKLYNNGSFQSE